MSKERTLKIQVHGVSSYIRCYDEETEVLTLTGWKKIKDVNITNNLVVTLNPMTLCLEYQEPIEKFEYEWNDKLYYLDAKYVNLLVTPEHKMFIAKRQRNSSWTWRLEEAKDNIGKRIKYKKSALWLGVEIPEIQLGKRRIKTEDFLEFLGYYLSEGYYDHNPINGNYTVAIRQNPPLLYKMGKALEKVTGNNVFYEESKVLVRDKNLWNYVKRFGYSHEKYIDTWIKFLSPRLLNIFLKAFELGDGRKNTVNNRALYTSSIKLRNDLQEIIIKCGFSSDYTLSKKKGYLGNFGKSKFDLWRISICRRKETVVNTGKKMDTMIDYSGKVYCLEVPNHVLLVRRKGKTVFSGNSGYGTVTRYVTSLLKEAGFDILVSSYYGVEPGGVLIINGVPQLPCFRHLGRFGEGTCEYYYRSLKRDIAILISDYWAFGWFPDRKRILHPYVYSPMDHINYPPWLQQLVGSYEGIISLCKFQKKELEKYNIPSVVIPHGVDLKHYFPMDQRKARTQTKFPIDKFVILIVGANCYDEKTELLCKDGWLKYNEVTFNTEILTLNKDGTMEYQTPSDIIVQKYNGKMYKLKTKYLDCVVTPNHKLYVKSLKRLRKDRPKELELRNKIGRSYYFTPFHTEYPEELFGKPRWYKKNGGIWKGINKQYFILPNYETKWMIGKYHQVKRSYKRDSRQLEMSNFLKLLGYYISEGSCNNNTVFISQSNEESRKKMIEDLEQLPYYIGKYKEKIAISDVQLAKWFTDLNMKKADQKYIPKVFKQLEPHFLEILWDAIKLGDGWNTQSSDAIGTSSKRLADDLQEIVIKMGYAADVSKSYKKGHGKFKGAYIYTVHRNRLVLEPQNRPTGNSRPKNFIEKWIDYSGIIWDVIVPNRVVMIRRNGKTMWTFDSDKEDRKAFTQQFKAIRYFLEQNPDARKDIFVHVHSVSSQSPVIIRDKKTFLIDIVPIYSLFTKWKSGYEVHNLENIEVWANNKFTKVNYISRHPLLTKSKLKRIIVPSGIIEVTESHSLFDENGIAVETKNLKIKDELKLVSYPCLNPMTNCSRELAWILGFFAAEGTIFQNEKIVFFNNNVDLLNQCKEYIRIALGLNSFILNPPSTGKTSRLIVNSTSWTKLFKEWCYVYETKSRKTKKVPVIILNSNPDIMDAFLKGYYVGDGINSNYKHEYRGFKSVSQTLLQGLLYLLSQVTEQTFNLGFDEKKNAYFAYLRSPNNTRKQKLLMPNKIKEIQDIPHILRDSRGRIVSHQSMYVYDLSTEDESFMAGIGNILAHNSNPQDPRGFDLNALRVREQIQDVVQLEDPFLSLTGLNDQEMCALYNSGDVLLHPSRREGFGLCILESEACGVPVIAHDFSSMPNLVKGHGWLCKSAGLVPVGLKDEIDKMISLIAPTPRSKNKKLTKLYKDLQKITMELAKMEDRQLSLLTTPILGESAVPDVYDIARCIEEAYNKEDLRMKYARKSRKFALKYNWRDIVNFKWIPYLEKIEEELEEKKEIKWDQQFKFEGLE